MNPKQLEDLVESVILLHSVFDNKETVCKWLSEKNDNLGGVEPIQMVMVGRSEKVLMLVKNNVNRALN